MTRVFQLRVTRYSNLYLICMFQVNNLYQLPCRNPHLFTVQIMVDVPVLYLRKDRINQLLNSGSSELDNLEQKTIQKSNW